MGLVHIEYKFSPLRVVSHRHSPCFQIGTHLAKKYCKLGAKGLAKKMGVHFRKKRGLRQEQLEKLVVKED